MGESLGSMSLRDMKQLETRLEKGINKIRNKKVNVLNLLNWRLIFYGMVAYSSWLIVSERAVVC